LPEYLRNLITHGMPVSVKSRLNVAVDLTVPFDTSKYPLLTSYSLDFSMSGDMIVDGKKTLSTQGRTTLKMISEFHPLSHQ